MTVCEEIDAAAALQVAARILEAVCAPLVIASARHQLSASIGIAIGRGDPDALLADADAAAYRAKDNGRGRIELF